MTQVVIAFAWALEPSDLIEPVAQSPLPPVVLLPLLAGAEADVLPVSDDDVPPPLFEPLEEQAASEITPARRPATAPARV
ncbi:MAG: hypothetical protein ACTHMS_04810 [Jatrophihabitans sp.]